MICQYCANECKELWILDFYQEGDCIPRCDRYLCRSCAFHVMKHIDRRGKE